MFSKFGLGALPVSEQRYLLVMGFAAFMSLITLLAILDLTFQGKVVPSEIYAILGASSGIIFGGQFINKIPPDNE